MAEHLPDLAIVDVRMPPDHDSDGARAAAAIRRRQPAVGILLLSQHIELRHCLDLVGTPGFGYLLKDRVLDLDEFDDACVAWRRAGVALDPQVVQASCDRPGRRSLGRCARASARSRTRGRRPVQHLDPAALALSERTVEAHMRSIFTKLNLSDDDATHRRVRAVIAYLESGATPGDS